MFLNPFSLVSRRPSWIAMSSVVAILSLQSLQFMPSTIAPASYLATTPMPVDLVRVHHEALQIILTVFILDFPHFCCRRTSWSGRSFWLLLICSSKACRTSETTISKLVYLASMSALDLAFHMCEHVIWQRDHRISRTFHWIPSSIIHISSHCVLSILIRRTPNNTGLVDLHSKTMCSFVSTFSQLGLKSIPQWLILWFTFMAFAVSRHM